MPAVAIVAGGLILGASVVRVDADAIERLSCECAVKASEDFPWCN